MSARRFACVLALGAGAMLCTGCLAKRLDVVDAKDDIIKNDNSNRELLSAEHVKMLTGDVEGLKAQVTEARKADETLEKALEAERERVRKAQDLLANVTAVVDSFLGGLSKGEGPLHATLTAIKDTAQGAKAASEKAKDLIDAEAQKRATATSSLEVALQGIRVDAETAKSSAATNARSMEDLRSRLETLSDTTLTRLAAIKPDDIVRLDALKADRAAFQAQLTKLVGEETAKELGGLSTEQIIGLIVATVAAAGAGGAVTRRGVADRLGQLETALGRDGVAAMPYLDEISERLEAVEGSPGATGSAGTKPRKEA